MEIIKKLVQFGLLLICSVGLGILAINLYIIGTGNRQTLKADALDQEAYKDWPILVLGAGIIDNAQPSSVLALRLDQAEQLSQILPQNPLIMSGDHHDQYYNEVAVMKDYLKEKGVASNRIYLDPAGYSTYESLYRLKEVIKADKVIIVTQGYHLSRALMLARNLGLEAVGVAAQDNQSTRLQRELREVFARLKDFAVCYMGYHQEDPSLAYGFSLSQSGDLTDHLKE